MKTLKNIILSVFIFIGFIQINAQNEWSADINVIEEHHIQSTEINVQMIVDLYHNGSLISVPSNAIIEVYRFLPLSDNPSWGLRYTLNGTNEFGTHTTLYGPPLSDDENIIDFYCTVILPSYSVTFNSDTIRVPWSAIQPDQQKNGTSFGSIEYWYKGDYRDNNGLAEFYVPRNEQTVLLANTNVVSQQKFSTWTNYENNVTYKNFIHFDENVDDFLSNTYISNFKPTYSATVRVKVDDLYLNILKFQDPWNRDFNESPYGLRNQGLEAEPEPLTNITNNLSTTSNHQGVLKNQNAQFDTTKPIYKISIPTSISVNGSSHTLNLLNWDLTNAQLQYSNQLTTGVVFTGNNASVVANIKGSLLSNDNTAYANGSQRKFVRTYGTLCSVYESMGKIWVESSTDNGQTWDLLNNHQPLNGSTTAKNPSLSVIPGTDHLAVVYQEGSKVKILVTHSNNITYGNFIIHSADVVNTSGLTDANPVVAVQYTEEDNGGLSSALASNTVLSTNYNKLYVIVWQKNSSTSPGLYYRKLQEDYLGNFSFIGSASIISNTDVYSSNPTIVAKPLDSIFHIAWEQDMYSYASQIRYYQVTRSGSSTDSFNGFTVVSTGDSYNFNYSPTLSVLEDNSLRLAWVGKPYNGSNSDRRIVLRVRHASGYWYNTFHIYGNNVQNVSVNSAQTGYYYGFAWVEGDGVTNRYIASGVGNYELDTHGNYLQVCNGNGTVSNMRAMVFNNSSVPYNFEKSNYFGEGLQKTNDSDYEGRTAIVTLQKNKNEGGKEYYYSLNEVLSDNEMMKFEPLDDTIMIKNEKDLKYYLTTKSFMLTESSELSYKIEYGLCQKNNESTTMKDNENIKFKVVLIDAKNEKVLTTLDDIKFNEDTKETNIKKGYKIQPKGIKSKKVKLRLEFENNTNGEYTISSSIYNNKINLQKENYEEITLNLDEIPTKYSLSQNYPNPFNPTTTINYQISKVSKVTLKVYDVLGKEVKTLVDEIKESGQYSVKFNGSNLASGVYFYKITAGSFSDTKKFILMK